MGIICWSSLYSPRRQVTYMVTNFHMRLECCMTGFITNHDANFYFLQPKFGWTHINKRSAALDEKAKAKFFRLASPFVRFPSKRNIVKFYWHPIGMCAKDLWFFVTMHSGSESGQRSCIWDEWAYAYCEHKTPSGAFKREFRIERKEAESGRGYQDSGCPEQVAPRKRCSEGYRSI